jgi:hypothetical protein
MTTPQRITTSLAVALALATGAGPALAGQFDLNSRGSYVPAAGSAHALGAAAAPSVTAGTLPTIGRVTAPSRGFDWGDAGIGAAGGFALSMIAIGGPLAVSQHRTRSRLALTNYPDNHRRTAPRTPASRGPSRPQPITERNVP